MVHALSRQAGKFNVVALRELERDPAGLKSFWLRGQLGMPDMVGRFIMTGLPNDL